MPAIAPLPAKPLTEVERLRAQLAEMQTKLAAKAERKLTLKVSEKGAVSVYGLGRFPVTLYAEQWQAVFEKADDIAAFITANSSRLKSKGE